MKKQLLFLLICFGLIMPGSSFITESNAQTKSKGAARMKPAPKTSQKPLTELKKQRPARIADMRKNANRNAGDPCSTDVPITLGQTLNGNLTSGDCEFDDGTFIDFYSFNGTAGQPISVSMNSGAFDTFLYLIDETGELIDLNDDSGESTNSRIPADGGVVTLPYTGQFIIGASSYEIESGAYSISLNTDAACTATPITYNQSVDGTLSESDCAVGGAFFTDRYTFSGTAGQQISIAMNSAAVDSFLILHSPTGEGSTSNDDGDTPPNSRIPETGLFTLPETGTYTIEASSYDFFETGAYTLILTGPTVTPSANKFLDFDGDGKTDIGIFRPGGGEWWITASSTNVTTAAAFGSSTDKITPADFTGDGKSDLAFWRPSSGQWFILRSEDSSFYGFPFGAAGDVPAAADFDGDGRADAAVFRASNSGWYIQKSSGGIESLTFGTVGDSPVVADYDGDGKADIAITRINGATREWWIRRSSDGQVFSAAFGEAGDKAVQGDYTGDGKADIAIWRPSNGFWYIIRSEDFSFYGFPFGASTDTPAAGDFDGDGKFDASVFRASNSGWYQLRSTQGFTTVTFGASSDIPLHTAYIP